MDHIPADDLAVYGTLGFSDEALTAVLSLADQFRVEGTHLRRFVQYPDPGVSLILEPRISSPRRHFRYLHQMCLGHTVHFYQMSRVRAAYLCEAYLSSVRSLNPFGIFGTARSLLEVHASTAYLRSLLSIASAGDESEWAARGTRFFDVVVQGRYGTTDPQKQDLLKRTTSIRSDLVQPLRINNARRHLANSLPWVEAHYAALCDVVHPNLASQRHAGLGAGVGTVALTRISHQGIA